MLFDVPLHQLSVHFPIALAVLAAVYDLWAVYAKKPGLHETGSSLTMWSGLTSVLAVLTGLQSLGVSRLDAGILTGHAGLGIAAGIVMAGFAMVRYSAEARQEGAADTYPATWMALQIGGAILVIFTTFAGHRM